MDGNQIIILKVHALVWGRVRFPFVFAHVPGQDGYFRVVEGHYNTYVDVNDRLLKVQNQTAHGLTHEQLEARMVPNRNTSEILLHIGKGNGPVPRQVRFLY